MLLHGEGRPFLANRVANTSRICTNDLTFTVQKRISTKFLLKKPADGEVNCAFAHPRGRTDSQPAQPTSPSPKAPGSFPRIATTKLACFRAAHNQPHLSQRRMTANSCQQHCLRVEWPPFTHN